MNPIYFPFTYVSQSAASRLAACFSKIIVYQVSDSLLPGELKHMRDSDVVEIRVPVTGDEKKIQTTLKAYKNWANLHDGGTMAFLKTQANLIPFYSDTSISKIRTDIKKRIQSNPLHQNTAVKPLDHLFIARLFLAVAQEYDIHHLNIDQDLVLLEEMEQVVFSNLKGDPADSDQVLSRHTTTVKQESGGYMTGERINAWTMLLFKDREASGVYITGSQPVFSHLKEQSSDAKPILSIDSIPVCPGQAAVLEKWKSRLMGILDQLAKDPKATASISIPAMPNHIHGEKTVSLTVYLIPGASPQEYFGRFVESVDFQPDKLLVPQYSNTVIGLVEPQ